VFTQGLEEFIIFRRQRILQEEQLVLLQFFGEFYGLRQGQTLMHIMHYFYAPSDIGSHLVKQMIYAVHIHSGIEVCSFRCIFRLNYALTSAAEVATIGTHMAADITIAFFHVLLDTLFYFFHRATVCMTIYRDSFSALTA
jgi:hypothetical protein